MNQSRNKSFFDMWAERKRAEQKQSKMTPQDQERIKTQNRVRKNNSQNTIDQPQANKGNRADSYRGTIQNTEPKGYKRATMRSAWEKLKSESRNMETEINSAQERDMQGKGGYKESLKKIKEKYQPYFDKYEKAKKRFKYGDVKEI